MKQKTVMWLAHAACLLLLTFSCRKMDRPANRKQDAAVAARFLELPATTSPEIRRVAATLATLNRKAGFLNAIAAQAGYPVWDKAIYHTPPLHNGRTTTAALSADTLLYIPLVLDGTQRVSAFLYARLDGSVHLQLHQAKDYARYGFGSIAQSTHNAERLALQIMVLDRQVFGYTDFDLLDDRLFRDSSLVLPATDSISRQLQLQSTAAASHFGRNAGGHWEEGTVTHCVRTNTYTAPHRLASMVASEPRFTCTTTVQYYFVADDEDPDTGGTGNGGGGGGGGGGTPPTGPEPCNPTPELDNGLPPCPRGSEDGWIPWIPPAQDNPSPCELLQEAARKLDTLYAACGADSVLSTIPDLATETKEKGFPILRKISVSPYSVLDTVIRGYFSGEVHTGTDSNISYTFTHGLYEIPVADLHTHPSIGHSAPSAKDIYNLIESKMQDTRYMGSFVVAANSSRYALSITDPAKAATFFNTKSSFLTKAKWNEESPIGKAFGSAQEYYYKIYTNNPNKVSLAYEMAMAAVLKQYDVGITLNKKDASGHFKPIVVNTIVPNIDKPEEKKYIQGCL